MKTGEITNDNINILKEESDKYFYDGVIKEYKGFVILLDVLGWKKKADADYVSKYFYLINCLRTECLDIALRSDSDIDNCNIDIINLSDTLAILISENGSFNPINIFNKISNFLARGLKGEIAFRGAISYGQYYTNEKRNIFVGDAFYEAHSVMEKTEWAGVVLTNSAANLVKDLSVDELFQLNIIKYVEIPFKKDENYETYKSICQDELVIFPCDMYRMRTILTNRPVFDTKMFDDFKEFCKSNMKKVKNKQVNTVKFLDFVKQTLEKENNA